MIPLLPSCIEYRAKYRDGSDHYHGWANTRKDLDPRLGSRGKLFLVTTGKLRPYVSGSVRRGNLRGSTGILYYLDRSTSIELGIRRILTSVDVYHERDFRPVDIEDIDDIIYLGGVIKF